MFHSNHVLLLEARSRGRPSRTQLGNDFMGVLLNPPWKSVTPKQVEALGLSKLCPVGFVFIWVEKEVLDQVVDAMVRMKYVYVENLTWVLMAANNRARCDAAAHRRVHHMCSPTELPRLAQVLQGDAPFIGRSHRTMLIFRRDVREFPKGKEIELRHQRSPDVEVQIVNTAAGACPRCAPASPRRPSDACPGAPDGRILTPESAYVAIETLLPGGYTAGQPGHFLELWGHAEIRRAGWTHVCC